MVLSVHVEWRANEDDSDGFWLIEAKLGHPTYWVKLVRKHCGSDYSAISEARSLVASLDGWEAL